MDYETVLRNLVRGLLSHPEALQIRKALTPRSVLLSIHAHATDKPRLIGKGGKTIAAINTLMTAAAFSSDFQKSVRISIEEEVTGEQAPSLDFVADPLWNRDGILVDGLLSIATQMFNEPIVNAVPSGDRTTLVLYAKGARAFEEPLNVIFKAWGRNMGRMVGVETYETEAP